jgi:hypothetical protein
MWAVEQAPGQVPAAPPSPVAVPTNALAIVSLACGAAGMLVVPVVGSIVAVVTGHMARSQVRRTGEAGAGMALAGLILGYAGLAIAALVAVLIVIGVVVAGVFVLSGAG